MIPTVIACEAIPLPKFRDGTDRKTYDLLRCLPPDRRVDVLVYPETHAQRSQLETHWASQNIQFHYLKRRRAGQLARSILYRQSMPTSSRDFGREFAIIKQLMRRYGHAKLVIDFISGAPLVEYFGRGVLISAHDCMSHLFSRERAYAHSFSQRARLWVRETNARAAERRYYHKAEIVHVVTGEDGERIKRINKDVTIAVVPLSGERILGATERRIRPRKLIWGNLASPSVLVGTRDILRAGLNAHFTFEGWTLLGRLEHATAHELIPELCETRIQYEEHVNSLTELLDATSVVLLPDIGGTGQKHRLLDALNHGCCTVGLPEVFRGLSESPGFVKHRTPADIIEWIQSATAEDVESVRSAALAVGKQFHHETVAGQWNVVLESLQTLELRP